MSRESDWRDSALCAQVDPELFFPDKGLHATEAKKVCMACDVREECLEWALESGADDGIYGGLSEDGRRKLKKLRNRERAA